ncbi:hypothetical protein FA15DRAFT_663579 [Coprinopsis marcescibilis]|uniref:Uncharacterized protein n=1 Tax=Coprinopsis marcescibilis TaxID=230819 RepID=A0A5C3LBF8_COPMA|nr:hypothetical protein FA15DRAFT_663579 [Coprinopsis marcescibilis]
MVYVPFFSEPSVQRRNLWKRKGGGGGGGRGGGGGGRGGGGGGGRGGSSGAASSGRSVSTGSGAKSASTFSRGGGSVGTIPAGSAFGGRSIGGGTRNDVYGSRAYGSGYPGVAGAGVAGRGFPFFFWPVAFGAGGVGYGGYHYHSEYGHPRNGSRPGGQLMVARYNSIAPATTFRLLADKESVESVNEVIQTNCGSSLEGDISVEEYDGADVEPPRPEEVIQYYRASSVALSLDGYNNTAVFEPENTTTPDVPLPSNIHLELLECLNSTIGQAVPLVDGAGALGTPPGFAMFGLVGLVWMLTSQL